MIEHLKIPFKCTAELVTLGGFVPVEQVGGIFGDGQDFGTARGQFVA